MGRTIPELSTKAIANSLGLDSIEIIERELILNASKRIERIKYKNDKYGKDKEIFIKYAPGQVLIAEIFFYDKLAEYVKDQVPKMINAVTKDDMKILVIEWIDGNNPDLHDQTIVEKVFYDLGKWTTCWEKVVKSYTNEMEELPAQSFFNEMMNNLLMESEIKKNLDEFSIVKKRDHVLEVGNEKMVEFINTFNDEIKKQIIAKLYSVPLTLHPGDVSKYNTLIRNENGQTVFIDFENMKIGPMSLLMEYIGEQDIHVPNYELNEIALRSYLQGWNDHSKQIISWKQFYQSYLAARILYKCYLLNWYFKRKASNSKKTPDKEWAMVHAKDLLQITDEFKASI